MLKNRLFISYLSTMLLYLLFAGILFYIQNTIFVATQESKEQIICMSLSSFVPETVTPIEQLEQEEVTEEPLPKEEPVTEVKSTVEPEVSKEPLLEEEPVIKEVIPEPAVLTQKPKPVAKQAKKKPQVKKKTQKKTAIKNQVKQKVSQKQAKSSPAQQNQFLANIRARINQHKSYPRIAKKRGIQGAVNVKFTILSSGKVGNISVSGPKVFHGSAQNAVQSAFPIDAKKAPISLPTTVNITLQYKIR